MIDSHAHLYFDWFDADREQVFDRARAAGVERFVVVGIDPPSIDAALALGRARADVSVAIGFHPNDLGKVDEKDWLALEARFERGGIVAVGETGLDYHHKDTTREQQFHGFRRHLDLARRFDLPVIVHCRDAWDDMLDFVAAEGRGTRGIMHCFSGDVRHMERSIALGYDVSFAGPLTYRKSETLREVCRLAPEDRIHIETDCPFLPPQEWRGKRNEPSYMTALIETIAAVRGTTPAAVDRFTTRNSKRLFGLP